MIAPESQAHPNKAAHKRWRRYGRLILYLVAINLVILVISYILHSAGDAAAVSRKLEASRQGFIVFGVIRGVIELLVFFNWRAFVGWCRRTFNLGYRKTWFVYQCRTLWKMFIIFDIGTFILVNLA